jgi:hypothetical protein
MSGSERCSKREGIGCVTFTRLQLVNLRTSGDGTPQALYPIAWGRRIAAHPRLRSLFAPYPKRVPQGIT